jgi:hypothetical protein
MPPGVSDYRALEALTRFHSRGPFLGFYALSSLGKPEFGEHDLVVRQIPAGFEANSNVMVGRTAHR